MKHICLKCGKEFAPRAAQASDYRHSAGGGCLIPHWTRRRHKPLSELEITQALSLVGEALWTDDRRPR